MNGINEVLEVAKDLKVAVWETGFRRQTEYLTPRDQDGRSMTVSAHSTGLI
jgi:hypothetical protein